MGKSGQINSLGKIVPTAITIAETAKHVGVSTATIRNWIKTKYLEQAGKGRITVASLERFESDICGKEKLTQRANKSLKDSHDHDSTVSNFLQRIALSEKSLDEILDEIGADYESSLSDSYRNKEGIYYTPDEVVRDLFAMPQEDIKRATFCDPCCGSGNFIVRALELGFKPENIYGYDIDPVAVEVAKARIYKNSRYKSDNIKTGDFLYIASSQATPKFDYIYTNPPWGKKLPREERESCARKFGSGSSLDTCSLFFFACLECLNSNGKLGLLLPESFFNIATFESARLKALRLSIERLIDYGKVFKGLVTKAQAIVIRNTAADPRQKVKCESLNTCSERAISSFSCNPKTILNLYCEDEDARTLGHLMSVPFITLANRASWGLGIVTGNNRKFVKSRPESGYIPVFQGADISPSKLKQASNFIPSDLTLYQQVASLQLFQAKEKLIYKFISSRLCFFYDTEQRFVLNSANILIPEDGFPISAKVLGELLSSDFMNWVFTGIFNTHKILRGDLESMPIHSQFLKNTSSFDEESYLEQLQIERTGNGTYRASTAPPLVTLRVSLGKR